MSLLKINFLTHIWLFLLPNFLEIIKYYYFGYPRVMEVESGSGPGNVKFLKTESGSGICMQIPAGTRVIYYPVIH